MQAVIDKRTEFMSIVLMLTKYNEKYPHSKNEEANEQYIKEVYKWFDKYKTHKFIDTLNKIIEKYDSFSFSNPLLLAIQNFNQELNIIENFEENEFLNELNEAEKQKLLQGFSTFAKESKFLHFYDSQKEFYSRCIEFQNKCLEAENIETFFKEYYTLESMPKCFCNIILANSCSGGHGLVAKNILIPSISMQFDKEQPFPCPSMTVFHEMSHSIINPLTEKYLNKKQNFNYENATFYNNIGMINDYIIRASEILFLKNNKKPESFIAKVLNRKIASGFVKIELVVQELQNYQENKNDYGNFETYCSTLLNNVIEILNKDEKEKLH